MVLATAIAACSGSGAKSLPTLAGTSQVTVTATGAGQYTVDFGSVAIGQDQTATLTLTNGNSPLVIGEVDPPSDAEFGTGLTPGTAVPAAEAVSFTVDFKPFDVGSKSGTLLIHTDSAAVSTLTLNMKGIGIDVSVEVAPQLVDFGYVVVGTSGTKAITLTNSAGPALRVTPSAVRGTAAQFFSVDSLAPFTVSPGGTAQIEASYAPLAPKQPGTDDTAYFTLSLSTGEAVVITLQGQAVVTGLLISPVPLDFSFVQQNQERTIPLHILNVGNVQISIDSVDVQSAAQGFALAAGTPQTASLSSGQSLDLDVTFTPPAGGHYVGSLQVTSNDNLGQQTVPLEGYGGGAAISSVPSAVDFGLVPTTVTAVLPVICTNTGTDVWAGGQVDPVGELLLGAGFEIRGNGAFGASIDPGSPQGPLLPGQSVQVDVAYTPTMEEVDSATLTIRSNVTTPPAPPVLQLTGQGISEGKCSYDLTPDSLYWGQVSPGGDVYTQSFTITNLGPNECLVNGIALIPGSDPAFSMTNVVSQRLSAPGSGGAFPTSLEVPVSFAPDVGGSYSGTVGFTISDPARPSVRVPLSGTGTESCFLLKPSELNFGVVGLSAGHYCVSSERSITAVNGCATPVNVTAITWSSASPFSLTNTIAFPLTLQPGASSSPLLIGFAPTAAGTYFAGAQVQTDLDSASFGLFLRGSASTSNTQTDTFSGSQGMTDILWVMDTDDDDVERSFVAQAASDFITQLDNNGVDFQMAVTTADSCGQNPPPGNAEGGRILPCPGCKLDASTPTIITSADSNADDELAALLAIGTEASSCNIDEEFFEATYEALVSGVGATYNKANNFVRPGASLAVIVVNGDNEDDNSRTETPQWYASQFLAIKGLDHPELFSWSYIDPTEFGAAGGHQPFNTLPQRLASMLSLVGGVAIDTTQNDWEQGIGDLWDQLRAARTQFTLSGSPDPSTIQVYLDGPPPGQVGPGQSPGVLLPATDPNQSWNWSYEASTNQVVINPDSISLISTDTLYVAYTLACSQG